MRYTVTKSYGHEQGLSCAFRQWRAESHCRHIHGYALAFDLTFGANELDKNGWVIDFGSLKSVKAWLAEEFDHTLAIARDDPMFEMLATLGTHGLARVNIMHRVGCEAFASLTLSRAQQWLHMSEQTPRVRIVSVTCREHAGNSATAWS